MLRPAGLKVTGAQKLASVLLASTIVLAACAKIEMKPKQGGQGGQGGQTGTAPQPSAQQPQQGGQPGGQQSLDNSLQGDWEVGFQFNNTTINSTMHLEQQGNQFHGTGTDTQNGMAFKIEQGRINGGQVEFFKKYEGSPPVQYTGKLEMLNDQDYQGPYMSGDYTTASKGNIISNIWQAEKSMPGKQQQAPPQGGPGPGQGSGQALAPSPGSGLGQAPPDEEFGRPPDKPPDLSGKWEVGYEADFKTITSVMYMEQDGGRLTGHGTDINTKEKFTIDKGWYNFPKITIVRKYEKGKGAKDNRTLTFKAKVTIVAAKDYQGPYLRGKTSGGGTWEAQLIK